jgi:hypothetical protein
LSASGPTFNRVEISKLRIDVVKSIITESDLSVPDSHEGLQGVNGKHYSVHGIGSVFISLPFYIVGEIIGVPEVTISIINQLFGAATCVLVFLFAISLGYSRSASLLVAICYGLGTIAWPLAKQPFDHTIETFFILLSVYFVYQHSVNKRGAYLIYSAFSLGFAFITRPTSILVIPPLFIFLFMSYVKEYDLRGAITSLIKGVILFSIAFLPFVCLSLWYNYYRFGSIFETGYQLVAERTGLSFFTGTPLLTGLSGLLISPGKGFFYYSPVAILFFFSIKFFIKRHRGLAISFILIMLSYLIFISKNVYWHGDWAWGPRYLLTLTPFIIIPIAEIFDSDTWSKKKLLRIAVYSILILSLIIQIAAVSVDYKKHLTKLRFEENLNFSVVRSEELQPIVEPPPEIYFDLKRSALLVQFVYIYEIFSNMKDFKYSKPVEGTIVAEKMKAAPFYNVFDFWWLYKYFVDGSYSGFYVALILLILAIYAATRLWKISRKI